MEIRSAFQCRRVAMLAAALALTAGAAGPLVADASDQARELLNAAGVQGGLVVHVGCGDGGLTCALRANNRYLVHGLSSDPQDVAKARDRIHSLGLYGAVSIDTFDGERLPYADNLVNLVVTDDLSQATMQATMAEVMRVLAPGGTAYVKRSGQWTRISKPWPEDIGQWTHFLHDASNNAVANDRRVGPPRGLQWAAGPLWSRSHEFISSLCAMVSGGGRVFYVFDEGVTSVTDGGVPERWFLIARDAFNGVLLWKTPLPKWRGDEWKGTALRGAPGSVPRRLVADGDRLYMTLSHAAPISVLDAATGEALRILPGTDYAQEFVLAERAVVARLTPPGPLRGNAKGAVVAFDVDARQLRWSVLAPQFVQQSLAAADGRVIFGDGRGTVCLRLSDGQELWRAAHGRQAGERTFILHGHIVVEGHNGGLIARDAETGKTLWTASVRGGSMRGDDVFIANGCAWHASTEGVTGFDLKTGKPAKTIDPSSVQSAGHHLRCYRAKATEKYLITQFRGAEFVSLADDDHCQNDWTRGACGYGVMPANGLFYVPPNPCFCYPGVKVTGFNAFASDSSAAATGVIQAGTAGERLLRGPAYSKVKSGESNRDDPDAWPRYRHDARRTGATPCGAPAQVTTQWKVRLRGRVTPPVASRGRVLVSAKDEHTVYSLDADDGHELWHFVAGGPVDSPPTLYGDSVLFGCADGRLYCLRASDGALAWRFRAAPVDRRIVAFDQLESVWPVHGSVLVQDDLVYGAAGRSTYLDGGIFLFALDPQTGGVVHEARLNTWSKTRDDAKNKPFIPAYYMDGARSDILVSEGGYLYLGQYKLDKALTPQETPYIIGDPQNPVTAMDITGAPFTASDPDMERGELQKREFHRYIERTHPELLESYQRKYGEANLGDRRMGRHLLTTAGFLDDSWFNRTIWMYSSAWPGWYHAHRAAKSGQLLVIGPDRTYAVQTYTTRNRQSPLFTPGGRGYLLLADTNEADPVLDDRTRGATKGIGWTRQTPPVWHAWTPIRIRAMVLAGDVLFVAGPPDVVGADDPMASFEGRKGAVLRAVSASDGKVLSETQLDAAPAFDGLIAANGRLYMTTMDGSVVCLRRATTNSR